MKHESTYGKRTTTFESIEESLNRILTLSKRIERKQGEIIHDQQQLQQEIQLLQNKSSDRGLLDSEDSMSFLGKSKFGWENSNYRLEILFESINGIQIEDSSSEDFALAFFGEGEPSKPISIRNRKVKEFVGLLVYLQTKHLIPDQSLGPVVIDRCRSNGRNIPLHNIEQYISIHKKEGPSLPAIKIFSRLEKTKLRSD